MLPLLEMGLCLSRRPDSLVFTVLRGAAQERACDLRVGQNRRRDWNEACIVSALESIGVSVLRLSAAGCPDLLTWHPASGLRLIEVKGPRGKLTPQQVAFKSRVPFTVVRNEVEALQLFGVQS